ncbi:hypothetical protein Tco_1060350 [Tanacetum coccineum]
MGAPTQVCVRSCPNISAPAGRPFRKDYEMMRMSTQVFVDPERVPPRCRSSEALEAQATSWDLMWKLAQCLFGMGRNTGRMYGMLQVPPDDVIGNSLQVWQRWQAMSDVAFEELVEDSEEDDDEEDEEIEESIDSDSMSEDAEDEDPAARDCCAPCAWSKAQGGMDDESYGLR